MAAADVVCSEPDGQCICRLGAAGLKCESCQENFFGLSASGCQACNCDPLGAARLQCNVTTGVCSCKQGIGGDKCDQCVPAFYNFSSAGCMSMSKPYFLPCCLFIFILCRHCQDVTATQMVQLMYSVIWVPVDALAKLGQAD